MSEFDRLIPRTNIAYFSMEIALRPEIHTYSGGLGVLAGDTVRSCADLELPEVFVTLLSRSGYLRQEIDSQGRQIDGPDPWELEPWVEPLGAKVAVRIEGREVWVRPWLHLLKCGSVFLVPVLLLDTDLDENDAEDRRLTDRLYGGDDTYRLKQEIVLGIGGFRLLRALGFEIDTYHLNEGHSALPTLELLPAAPPDAGDGGPGRLRLRRCGGARALRVHHPHAGRGRTRPLSLSAGRADPRRRSRARPARDPGRRGLSQHDPPGSQSVGLR